MSPATEFRDLFNATPEVPRAPAPLWWERPLDRPGPISSRLAEAQSDEERRVMQTRKTVCTRPARPVQAPESATEKPINQQTEKRPLKRHVIVFLVKSKHDYELEYREESKGVWRLVECPPQLSGLLLEPDILKHPAIYQQQCYQKWKTETVWR